ncbi:MAG: IS1182 family transposase [Firmicutes bacterium]|nr:IS1182 family transposase [Bacillota bacterium]
MLGKRDTQMTFDDVLWRERIPENSVWMKLHEWIKKNLSEKDFEPLFSNTGRPSISPVHTMAALLIQLEKGYSDREMEEESRYDDRVKFAILANRNFEGIDAVTLCDHRRLFLNSEIGREILNKTLGSAKAAGLFSKENLQVVDSFMIWGKGAVQDTYTLIRKGVLRVLRIARCHGMEEELRGVLKRDDYEKPGKPKIDWSDGEEKRRLLESLVWDALNLVKKARENEPMPGDLADAVDLLERVARQDVEIGEDGRIEMVKGTCKDRVISVTDPEMRHGRKTSSRKVDGFKGHIITCGENGQLVAGVEVTAANVADKEPVPEMLEEQEKEGRRPEELLGDSAYFDPEMTEEEKEKGTTIVAKAPPVPERDGLYTKDDFEIDTETGIVTCPAGQEARFDVKCIEERKGATVFFGAGVCDRCPEKDKCTTGKSGRCIRIHPYEPEIQQAREYQKTEGFKDRYVKRVNVERLNSHLTRHGAREARYIGTRKVKFQLLLCGILNNIKAVMRAVAAQGAVCHS